MSNSPITVTTVPGRTAAQTVTDAAAGGGNPLSTLTIPQMETYINNNSLLSLIALNNIMKVLGRLLIVVRDQQAVMIANQNAILDRLTKGGL